MSNISEEKRKWMLEVGMKEFERPMKFYIGDNNLFSEEYIKNTPLKVLKEKLDDDQISNRDVIFIRE